MKGISGDEGDGCRDQVWAVTRRISILGRPKLISRHSGLPVARKSFWHCGMCASRSAATTFCIYVQTGGTLTGFGTLDTRAGAAVDDDGTIVATGGTLTVNGNIGGEGSLQIAANSTAMLTGTSYGVAGISFVGADATLSLATGAKVANPISGFTFGDIIQMANVDAVSFNAANGNLTLSDKGLQVDILHLAGSFAGDTLSVAQSTAGAMIALQHG